MEKKRLILIGVGLLVGSVALLLAAVVLLKPSDQKEAAKAGGNFSFPATNPAQRPPPLPTVRNEAARVRTDPGEERSSLEFLRASTGIAMGGSSYQLTPEAAAAAQAGDAKGVVAGLQQDEAAANLDQGAIRDIMQRVVDTVKEAKPRWYKMFLRDHNLKAIADRYDKDRDFGTFVRLLSKSKAFNRMIHRYSRTRDMRKLVERLLHGENGSRIEKLFEERANGTYFSKLVRLYGAASGLPEKLLHAAGVDSTASQSAAQRRAFERPKLKSGTGFSNFHSIGGGQQQQQQQQGQSGKAPPGMPAGMDPSMLEQYQKYMKKK